MLGNRTQIISWLLILLIFSAEGIAQGFDPGFEKKRHDYPIRAFFNKFSINLSTGYGRTFYRHTLNEYSYLRNNQGSFIFPDNSVSPNNIISGYSNWFSGAEVADIVVGNSPDSEANGYKLVPASDTSSILMKGGGYNFPVQFSVYYNLFRLRLGGGVELNFHGANIPQPDNFLSRFPRPGRVTTVMSSYFFLLGFSVYEYYDNAFGVDVRFGKLNMGKGFDRNAVEPNNYINIGVTLEKVISEYFRLYLRPAYEIRSFAVNLPQGSLFDHQANTLSLSLGVSINYPDLPRSPIKNDKIQMRHYISDPMGNRREFRGQPIWRKQDPKIGELYPELMKTKRKRQTQRKNFFKKKN